MALSLFAVAGCKLRFVEHFRYPSPIDSCLSDDEGIQSETLFTGNNTLCRRIKSFHKNYFAAVLLAILRMLLCSLIVLPLLSVAYYCCYSKCVKSSFHVIG